MIGEVEVGVRERGIGLCLGAFDARACFDEAVRRGAQAVLEPRREEGPAGAIERAAVATYGDIAEFVTGTPTNARLVGYAMAGLTGGQAQEGPWRRVINARGASRRPAGEGWHRRPGRGRGF